MAYLAAISKTSCSKYDLEVELRNEFGENYQIDDSNSIQWIISSDNESIEVPPLEPVETCSITFNSNGGIGIMEKQIIPYQVERTLADNAFSKENCIFTGWNTMEDGSGETYLDKQSIEITENITLYAQWRDKIVTEIKDGQTVNNRMKSIANNLTQIIYIKKSDTIADEIKDESNNIAIRENLTPVYMWFESGTVWYYTEADEIYLNSNASFLFNNLSKVKTIDLFFKTDNCTTMKQMFYNCNSLESIDTSGFNTEKCENMSSMFGNCTTLEKLNLGTFNTEKVSYMENMFNGSNNITELNVTSFNTPRLKSMSRMFSSLKKLKVLDIRNMDTSNVTNMEKCFDNMYELTTIYVSSSFVTTKVEKSNNMFINDTNLVGGNGTKYNSAKINKDYAVIDTESTKGYFTDYRDRVN